MSLSLFLSYLPGMSSIPQQMAVWVDAVLSVDTQTMPSNTLSSLTSCCPLRSTGDVVDHDYKDNKYFPQIQSFHSYHFPLAQVDKLNLIIV